MPSSRAMTSSLVPPAGSHSSRRSAGGSPPGRVVRPLNGSALCFIEGPAERACALGLQRRFTMAGTGHMLGPDVHDCARARNEAYVDGVLEPGMVLTVEPGLYFQPDDLTVPEEWRGIGVRIEDDLVVTESGHENLSAGLPRSADEGEA